MTNRPKRSSKQRKIVSSQKSESPQGKLVMIPPGIVAEHYELQDFRTYRETNDESDVKIHRVSVWTTQRDRLIDTWLTAERILRTACVLLLSPTTELQPRVWKLMERQSGDALIDLLGDLLVAKNYSLPDDFHTHLKSLAKYRNLLAHQASRPSESKLSDGLVFLKSTGFNEASYIEVTFDEIDQAITAVDPIMKWLVAELPEADMANVSMDDEVFDALEKRRI